MFGIGIDVSKATLDVAVAEQLEGQPGWKNIGALKGVGPILISTLACELPELGSLGSKAIASLVGWPR